MPAIDPWSVNGVAALGHLRALALLALALVGVLLGLGRKLRGGPALRAHYRRLGEVPPGAPCPCGRGRPYRACCRPGDVERLRRDIIDHLSRRWSRASYRGRSRLGSMDSRLADHPLPPVALPPWVAHPERHTFPLPADVLHSWRPRLRGASKVR